MIPTADQQSNEEETRRRAAEQAQQGAGAQPPADQGWQELGQPALEAAGPTTELLGAGLDLLLVATDVAGSVLGAIGEAATDLDAGGFQ